MEEHVEKSVRRMASDSCVIALRDFLASYVRKVWNKNNLAFFLLIHLEWRLMLSFSTIRWIIYQHGACGESFCLRGRAKLTPTLISRDFMYFMYFFDLTVVVLKNDKFLWAVNEGQSYTRFFANAVLQSHISHNRSRSKRLFCLIKYLTWEKTFFHKKETEVAFMCCKIWAVIFLKAQNSSQKLFFLIFLKTLKITDVFLKKECGVQLMVS